MSKADNKPGAEPVEPDDSLSATGMFLGAFQQEPDPFVAKEPEAAPLPPRAAARGAGPGEFTQLFDPLPAKPAAAAPPPSPPSAGPGEVTRIFATPAPPQKMRGFSSPGASDSASAEGSFTQLFRTPSQPAKAASPPPPVEKREWPSFDPGPSTKQPAPAPESMGVTDLFRALSGNERPQGDSFVEPPPPSSAKPLAAPPSAPAESFTMLLQKLTEHVPASQNFETQQLAPAPAAPVGGGEFTRIITREENKTSSAVPAPQVAAETKISALPPVKVEVPKPALPAAPKPAIPKISPPKSKLQEMMPILLVLNAFLLVALIVLVLFALMHR